MDVQNGSDAWSGSATRPFKTITRALNPAFGSTLQDGDTVSIAPGYYQGAPGGVGGEDFPLITAVGRKNITIAGTLGPDSQTSTTIRAVVPNPFGGGFSNFPFTTEPVCLYVNEGWTVSGLVFEHAAFNKVPVSTNPAIQITGIRIVDLPGPSPTTDVRIMNCRFLDGFIGLHLVDTNASTIATPRFVLVSTCWFDGHGPVKAPDPQLSGVPQSDRGHQGLLTQNHRSMTINVAGCLFTNNHDGLESGNGPFKDATINITRSTFSGNENGLEVGSGALAVAASNFILCDANDPVDGGVGEAVLGELSTSGIGLRGTALPGSTLTVRTTTFDRCQTGAQVRMAGFASLDFGSDTLTDPGSNRFLTDITVPWPLGEAFRAPYCGLANNGDTPVLAMGNLWTYDASGAAPFDFNQQALPVVIDGVTYGSYDSYTSPVVFSNANGVNFDGATGFPKPRPTSPTPTDPNSPWNLSTGTPIIIGGVSITPSIQVR
ncbi:MAG: DUF1565 domain-containing protein [Planctomycetes bacterium]|nr:DUF1565 domain-containing protein [Planctomycetota bacterium]